MDSELKTMLEEYHADERADIEKYRKMADKLESVCPRGAGILRDIACDEKSHAAAIHHILARIEEKEL